MRELRQIAFLNALALVLLTPSYVAAQQASSRAMLRPASEVVNANDGKHYYKESAAAEHALGSHFRAMIALLESEAEPTLADKLAGAESAWALGLINRARNLWIDILAQRGFQGQERYRAMLGRAILELQEGQYEEARSIAEQAAAQIGPSDIRAQLWLVVAEALKEQQAYSVAESYYKKAIEEGGREVKNEARYLLGESQIKLGMMNEARYAFTGVESSSSFTPQALRRLIEIDLQQRNYEGALTWITEGRESFPTEFRDGQISYAMVTALCELNRQEEALKEVEDLKVRHSVEHPWFVIASAAVEAKLAAPVVSETDSAKEREENP